MNSVIFDLWLVDADGELASFGQQ